MRDSRIMQQPNVEPLRLFSSNSHIYEYTGAKVWNELATYFKETTDLNDFKSLLDTWNGQIF